jgi:trehalose 6-phosphate synthase/phosphatase
MKKGKLIVVSNRGPYKLSRTKNGLKRTKTIGGLVTSVLPMMKKYGGVWVAWGEPEGRYPAAAGRPDFTLRYLRLSGEQERGFYWGLSNTALWPLCHSFLGRVRYDAADWNMYEHVNRLFAGETIAEMEEEDLVWIHDYQLSLVPQFLRTARPSARLAFFWHIPFPATEIYRTFPWRAALLKSLLACDLIGFHIPEYRDNFFEAAVEILGAEVDGEFVCYSGRRTRILARPIGIDYLGIERLAQQPRIRERVRELKSGLPRQTILLGVERMDYTKGILERLRAVENLLERKPNYRGAVTLIQIVTPSREFMSAYQQKKREIDEIVGRINGKYSSDLWIPIRYLFRSFSLNNLIAYYCLSDIALITPLRDGLNLVAKEFIASRLNHDGVVILSEFAGVAWQLPEAILVNPYSEEEMSDAIDRAIQLPKDEQQQRMQRMQDRIRAQDFSWWTEEFLRAMEKIRSADVPAWPDALRSAVQRGQRPWIFLDYDGTLVPIARTGTPRRRTDQAAFAIGGKEIFPDHCIKRPSAFLSAGIAAHRRDDPRRDVRCGGANARRQDHPSRGSGRPPPRRGTDTAGVGRTDGEPAGILHRGQGYGGGVARPVCRRGRSPIGYGRRPPRSRGPHAGRGSPPIGRRPLSGSGAGECGQAPGGGLASGSVRRTGRVPGIFRRRR